MSADMSRRQFLQFATMGAAAVAGLGLVGCGSSSDSSSSSGSSKLESIKSAGKLKCGVKKDVPGYGYQIGRASCRERV